MKIKTVYMDIEEVLAQPVQQHVYPKRPNIFSRMLLRAVSAPDLKATNFKYREFEMEKRAVLGTYEPFELYRSQDSLYGALPQTPKYCLYIRWLCGQGAVYEKPGLHTYPQVRNGYPVGTGYDVCTEKAEKLHTYVSRGKLYI